MRDLHVWLLSALLAAIGLVLAFYKVERLGLPLNPGTDTPVWTVEARIKLDAKGAVKAEFTLPDRPPGFWVLDEDFISSNFGLVIEGTATNRRAKWAIRRATGDRLSEDSCKPLSLRPVRRNWNRKSHQHGCRATR